MSHSSTDRTSPFPTTHWSVVMLAGNAVNPEIRRLALESILRQYLPALQAFVHLQYQFTSHDADDLVQGFVTDILVQRSLLARADRRRGRFRALLSTALGRYIASQHRRRLADKRAPERAVSLNELLEEPDHDETAPVAFDQAWAREVIAQTLEHMEHECRASGHTLRWTIFEARVVGPILHQAPPPSYEQLIRELGVASPSQASNALATAKRMFERLLREFVARYTPDEDIDDEISHIRRILAQSGAR